MDSLPLPLPLRLLLALALPRRRALLTPAALASLVALAGCGSPKPASGTYTVDFPSELTAITTDSVQVFVYPYDGTPGTCTLLVEERASGAPLPSPMAQTKELSPCALLAGGNELPVGFGQYAFLAVAARQGFGDYLIGCAAQVVSSTNTVVTIPLELTDFMNALPTSSCTMLSQRCAGGSC
jgi:hypothetical protein